MAKDQWVTYLQRFHDEHAGITEDVLTRARDERGATPYDWLNELTTDCTRGLDAACGSGAAMAGAQSGRWLGVDTSLGELTRARQQGHQLLTRADLTHLPLSEATFDVVVISMALMLISPLEPVVAELTRVLRPGGRLVALVPTTWPLNVRDLTSYRRLAKAYTWSRLSMKQPALTHPRRLAQRSGLEFVGGERRRFAYPLVEPDDALRFVSSLYAPESDPTDLARAASALHHGVGRSLGVALRRLVWRRATPQRARASSISPD